jgi:hypothetical protein
MNQEFTAGRPVQKQIWIAVGSTVTALIILVALAVAGVLSPQGFGLLCLGVMFFLAWSSTVG